MKDDLHTNSTSQSLMSHNLTMKDAALSYFNFAYKSFLNFMQKKDAGGVRGEEGE